MNLRVTMILGALLVFAGSLMARDKTDVIIMSNGDRITGEIKGLSSGVLRVDLDYVDGAISIQWSKVKHVESNQLFILQAQDGSFYTGTLTSAPGDDNKVEIAQASDEKVVVEQAKVVRMEETGESFVRRLSGDVDFGVVYSKGNGATQYTLGSEIEFRRERWGFQTDLNSNLSSNTGSNTSTRNQVDLIGYHLLPWKNYFYSGLGSALQSSEQGINLQTSIGVGIGRYLKNTNRARISVIGGVAWQSTKYDQSTRTIAPVQDAAGLIAADLRFFIFKKTNFTLRSYLLPSLTDHGRIHFNTNASYYVKIIHNLSWNFSFYGNWDTRPPGNFSGSDYGYSSGLKWTFGYK
jgi:hypothetical protein